MPRTPRQYARGSIYEQDIQWISQAISELPKTVSASVLDLSRAWLRSIDII